MRWEERAKEQGYEPDCWFSPEDVYKRQVLIVNEGSISQYGTPEEIIQTPGNRFVKDFILNQLEIKRNNIFALFQKEFLRKAQAVS